MENKAKGKCRNANFSATEKQLFLSLICKYKEIIENKKTDAVMNQEKQQTWVKICNEFNSACPDTRSRNVQSLKKLYNNRKKEIRKVVAEETKERYLTGGGTAKVTDCADKELVLSLMNEKTVYGVGGNYDSDAVGILQETDGDLITNVPEEFLGDEIQEFHESEPASKRVKVSDVSLSSAPDSWSHYKPAMLSTPATRTLKKTNGTFDTSRRRPTTVVRTLSSSVLAEKYNLLVDKRLEIAEMEIKKIEADLNWQRQKRELEVESLMLDIKLKKKDFETKDATLRKL